MFSSRDSNPLRETGKVFSKLDWNLIPWYKQITSKQIMDLTSEGWLTISDQ